MRIWWRNIRIWWTSTMLLALLHASRKNLMWCRLHNPGLILSPFWWIIHTGRWRSTLGCLMNTGFSSESYFADRSVNLRSWSGIRTAPPDADRFNMHQHRPALSRWVVHLQHAPGEGQWPSGSLVEPRLLRNPEGPGSRSRLGSRRSSLISIGHAELLSSITPSLALCCAWLVTMALHVHCGLGQLSPLPTSVDDEWVAANHCRRAKRSRISDTHLQFRYINNQNFWLSPSTLAIMAPPRTLHYHHAPILICHASLTISHHNAPSSYTLTMQHASPICDHAHHVPDVIHHATHACMHACMHHAPFYIWIILMPLLEIYY